MARARKGTKSPKTFPTNMSKRQMKRKKPIDSSYLRNIEPLTDNQEVVFDAYAEGQNCVLHGAAGTGKTFIVLYNALKEVLSEDSPTTRSILLDRLYLPERLVSCPGYS